jgi:hypothetical protein
VSHAWSGTAPTLTAACSPVKLTLETLAPAA